MASGCSNADSRTTSREEAFREPKAAYVHVPFCAHRCGYCNFTLIAGRDDLIGPYLDALEIELSWLSHPRPIETLFLGGGTPSHLDLDQLRRLLRIVMRWFPLNPRAEFSVEVNPADLDAEKVALLANAGVTRISLGAQSFHQEKLRLLERDHTGDDVRRAFRLARDHIDSVALDLIFGVPGETSAIWRDDLSAALELGPDHVSTYGLTFERGTRFWARRHKGQLEPLQEELERELYATAIERLTSEGLEHYEVSNFARAGRRCRHNETYWLGNPYFAAGPGAARYVAGRRETNHRSPLTWLKRIRQGESVVAESEELSAEDRAREMLVFGLRRIEGVDCDRITQMTGVDVAQLAGRQLDDFCRFGLLERDGQRLRMTRKGLFISDSMWPELL